MRFPDTGITITKALYMVYRDLARGSDDDRRRLTKMMAEQMCFALGPRWGTKRADPGRPPSKDSLAFNSMDGQLWNFDWQNGSTREPNEASEMEDITGQVFMAVAPVDHLTLTSPGPSPPAPAPPPVHPAYPGDAFWDRVGDALFADYAEARQLPNPGMGRWLGRTIWDAVAGDANGHIVTIDASLAKHRKEWRAVLGLPASSGV